MARKETKPSKVIVMSWGKEYSVHEETSKYYICVGGTQFKKTNLHIKEIKKIEERDNE